MTDQYRQLPATGFIRLPDVLAFVPIGRSSWWAGVRDGKYPKPVKLSPQVSAWRAEDIHALIDRLGKAA